MPARKDRPADVLVVSVGATGGWRTAADELAASISRLGATVALVQTGPVRGVRTFALTDLVQARAARRTAEAGIAAHRPAAIVYCSITAALLWPAPGAIWLDCLAAENRPGRHGVWQRMVERRRLAQASLVLTMSDGSLTPLGGSPVDAVLVPCPIEPSRNPAEPPPRPSQRDIAAITYAGDPDKKRLDVVLDAWARARREDEMLIVAGTDAVPPSAGVLVTGRIAPADYRALLRRARVFLAAPRREDYGIAPLEALADGCLLVSTAAPGPYPALGLARELDPRLVGEDLAGALRLALDDPLAGYAERAAELLRPFRSSAVDRRMAHDVLPRLLPAWAPR